jgi:opacity protein-like surface antigen
MFKKISLVLFALVMLPLLAVAGDGFRPYIGFTGGIGAQSGYYRAYDTASKDVHYATIGKTTGLAGGVLGAQLDLSDHFFFAIQGNALWHSLDSKTVLRSNSPTVLGTFNHIVHIKNSFQFGADLRLGMRAKKAIAYILAGGEAGRWHMAMFNSAAIASQGVSAFSRVTTSDMRVGPKVGGGVTFPLWEGWFANMEYSYTWFGSLNKTLTDSLTGHEWRHRENIRQNTTLFGINYLF